MDTGNIFQFVKEHVTFVDYFTYFLPHVHLSQQRDGVYRCPNVIAGGSNQSSMVVDDNAGFFKCFSHGQESGDVIALHMALHQIPSAFDATKDIADRLGLVLPAELLSSHPTGPSSYTLTTMFDKVAHWAHDFLMNSDDCPQAIIDYVNNRHISQQQLDTWCIGALPSHMDSLLSHLRSLLSDEEWSAAQSVGFISEDGRFVPMSGRLLFPLMDTQSRTIGFSARKIDGVTRSLLDSKYINSRTSSVYNKSAFLMGEQLSRRTSSVALICEGNLDVMALTSLFYHKDIDSFALCGTALTESHLPLLSQKHEIVLCVDSDDAGQDALMKYSWLLQHVPSVTVMMLSGGKDPWDIYVSHPQDLVSSYSSRIEYIPVIVARAFATLSHQDFASYISQVSTQLVSFDDKNKLAVSVANTCHISLTDAHQLCTGSSPRPRHRTSDTSDHLSPSVAEFITFLLGADEHVTSWLMSTLDSDLGETILRNIIGATDHDLDYIYGAVHPHSTSPEMYDVLSHLYSPVDPDTYTTCLLGKTLVTRIIASQSSLDTLLPTPYVTVLARLRRQKTYTYGDILTLVTIGCHMFM